jgi:cytochrome c oxidase assembly factor CtaG
LPSLKDTVLIFLLFGAPAWLLMANLDEISHARSGEAVSRKFVRTTFKIIGFLIKAIFAIAFFVGALILYNSGR